jgi:type I restriction enzyme, S subunit
MSEEREMSHGWETVRLGDLVVDPKKDLVDGPFGSNLKAEEYVDSGVPVFKIQNIKANRFVDSKISFVREEKAKCLSRHSFVSGDLIITKLGDPLGLCCRVPEKYGYGVIVADLMRLRPSNKVVHDQFLIYAINCNLVQDQFKVITKGTTRPRVNLTIVRDIQIPLPPLAEQHRIVAKIEELFSSLDKGIEDLKTAQQQLKVYRQAVLKWAFEGRLTNKNVADGELPMGWRWASSGDLFSFVTSGSRGWAKYHSESGAIFIRITNLDFDTLDLDLREDKIQYVSPPPDSEGMRTKVVEGDFLFSITGYLGMFAIAPHLEEDAFINQHIALCRPRDGFNKRFVGYWAIAKAGGFYYLNKKTRGATKAGLGLDDVKSFPVPLPTLPEQQAIVAEIESRLSVADKIEETITDSLKQAEFLRQSILKKAFEGKLVPQDPNDEPASVLLARIKAERESNGIAAPRPRRGKNEAHGGVS